MLVGIDTGGTYTDAVLFDEERGVVAAAKALTTKHDLSIGVSGALAGVLPEDRSSVRMVALSTTLATNALVEGHGSPVCLLLIGYGRDALARSGLAEALGRDPVAFIQGGHQPTGDEAQPLDLAAARQEILTHAPKAAAFVVAGYFGVRNPAHEVRVRDLARELTGLPVTCAHELTTDLDAPRRAMTAVLNGRLIPLLQHLILAVQGIQAVESIEAPLMVVKGDGSLLAAETALTRPIETILSGPAASVVGARYLSGEDDVLVSDIGGTTTDIALLRDGRPSLNRDGARVGGWRTMVEAVAVHTVGLGGDSEVRLDDDKRLVVGPRRAVPLSLLTHQHPEHLTTLEAQAAREAPGDHDGRFALRLRPLDAEAGSLTSGERKAWQALEGGPVALEHLLADHHLARPLQRLIDRGLVIQAAFTPSDASHLLGWQNDWNGVAARLGAQLWVRRLAQIEAKALADGDAFARRVVDLLVIQSGKALVSAAMSEEEGLGLETPGSFSQAIIERALIDKEATQPLVDFTVKLGQPLVGIGAPAATYYPEIAKRLNTRLVVPEHAGVTNAIGAVASGVSQTVKALITAPTEDRFRVHVESGVQDFPKLDQALSFAEQEARALAFAKARDAGADEIEVRSAHAEKIVKEAGGKDMFIEAEVVATAFGRPRLTVG